MITYILSANKNEANEGDVIVITLSTSNVSINTKVAWEMLGIDNYDVIPRSIEGRFIINENGQDSYQFVIDTDWKTEGVNYITFRLKNYPEIYQTIKVNDTSIQAYTESLVVNKKTVTLNDIVGFELLTTGYKEGTQFTWLITDLTDSEINPNNQSGIFVLNSEGRAYYEFDVTKSIEGSYLIFTVLELNLYQTIYFGSEKTLGLSVNKTSLNVDDKVTITLETKGIEAGTNVNWEFTKLSSNNISPNTSSGIFIVDNSGKASYTFTVINDIDPPRDLEIRLSAYPDVYVSMNILKRDNIENPAEVNNTKTIYIAFDSLDVNLLSLYKDKYGDPLTKTKVIFIINPSVKILASRLDTFAIKTDYWPSGCELKLINSQGSLISGLGGNGGSVNIPNIIAAGDGGTAILADNSTPLLVENNGIISGGAGGGAACYDVSSFRSGFGGSNSSLSITTYKYNIRSGGGGQPLGKTGTLDGNSSSTVIISKNYGTDATLIAAGSGNSGSGSGGTLGMDGQTANASKTGNAGKAGYIAQGPVTINNINGGSTMGRQ